MLGLLIDLAAVMAMGSLLQQIVAPLAFFGPDFSKALYVVLYFVLSLLYTTVAEWTWRGQTIGKRLMRLRVVDAGGFRLEPSQVIVRNLMRFIDILPAMYLVGGISCFVSRHRQRLGDLAAGTVVIRAPRIDRPDLDRLLGGKYNSLAEQRHLAARLRQKVRPEMAAIALEALLRREEIGPTERLELFRDLATQFRELVPYPAEVTELLSDEQYVRSVVEVLYRPELRAEIRVGVGAKS
jgi:uncharacterized RDD family membrane protein YckC